MFDNGTNNTNSLNFDNVNNFYDKNTFSSQLYQIKEEVKIVPWLK